MRKLGNRWRSKSTAAKAVRSLQVGADIEQASPAVELELPRLPRRDDPHIKTDVAETKATSVAEAEATATAAVAEHEPTIES